MEASRRCLWCQFPGVVVGAALAAVDAAADGHLQLVGAGVLAADGVLAGAAHRDSASGAFVGDVAEGAGGVSGGHGEGDHEAVASTVDSEGGLDGADGGVDRHPTPAAGDPIGDFPARGHELLGGADSLADGAAEGGFDIVGGRAGNEPEPGCGLDQARAGVGEQLDEQHGCVLGHLVVTIVDLLHDGVPGCGVVLVLLAGERIRGVYGAIAGRIDALEGVSDLTIGLEGVPDLLAALYASHDVPAWVLSSCVVLTVLSMPDSWAWEITPSTITSTVDAGESFGAAGRAARPAMGRAGLARPSAASAASLTGWAGAPPGRPSRTCRRRSAGRSARARA